MQNNIYITKMETKEKYYTPAIEEFYEGFEYMDKDSVQKFSLQHENDHDGDSMTLTDINNGFIKVKYLDKEDIESLGWKPVESSYIRYALGRFQIEKTKKGKSTDEENYWTIIEWDEFPFKEGEGRAHHLFAGIIKNKSELKKLMSQLNFASNGN